jgi:hypothetical protein
VKSDLEIKAESVREILGLPFQEWAKVFQPMENPAGNGELVFKKSDKDFLDKQDPNCIWPIFSVWKLYGTEYNLGALRYDEGYEDSEIGHIVTKKPFLGLDDPSYDEYCRGVQVGTKVTCVRCDNDEPDCEFCQGQAPIMVSMVGEISES